jgi:hypothetical protein
MQSNGVITWVSWKQTTGPARIPGCVGLLNIRLAPVPPFTMEPYLEGGGMARIIRYLCLAAVFVLAGCATLPETVNRPRSAAYTDTETISTDQIYANRTNTKQMVACAEPRPQVCTQDYRPVCALLNDGNFKTYANGCNACADPAVTGYREGPCE